MDEELRKWSKGGKETVFLLKTALIYFILKMKDEENGKLTVQTEESGEAGTKPKGKLERFSVLTSLKNDFFVSLRNYYMFKLNKNKEQCQNQAKIHKKYLVFQGDPMNYNVMKEEIVSQSNVSKEQIQEFNKFKINELKRITRALQIKETMQGQN